MAKSCSISTILRSRKAGCAIAALALLLGGCSNFGGEDLHSLVSLAGRDWGGTGGDVTLQQASAVPYATIGVRLGSSPQTMMILTGEPGSDHLLWTTKGVALTTVDGRIVRTSGLPHNLGGLFFHGLAPSGAVPPPFMELIDFPEARLYAIPVECRASRAGEETIRILGQAIHTVRIDENCVSKSRALDWSFRNVYWKDPDSGLVWRSLQHVNPQLDVMEIDTLRPPQ